MIVIENAEEYLNDNLCGSYLVSFGVVYQFIELKFSNQEEYEI